MTNFLTAWIGAQVIALFALVFVPLEQSDYTRLVPSPAGTDWIQEGEVLVWLDTSLEGVELRINGLDNGTAPEPALGFARLQLREAEAVTDVLELDLGGGCADAYDSANEGTDDNGTPDDPSDDTIFNYDAVWVPAGASVGIVACEDSGSPAAATAGMVSVYSGPAPDGELLAEYQVEAEPVPPVPPTPTPQPVALPPDFGVGYVALRFCADASSPRGAVLDGGESVGKVAVSGGSGLTYSLAAAGDLQDFAYFEVASSTGALTVSDLGADDVTGMDGTRLYSLVVRATDGEGLTGEVEAAVQLNLTDLSPAGDGGCP